MNPTNSLNGSFSGNLPNSNLPKRQEFSKLLNGGTFEGVPDYKVANFINDILEKSETNTFASAVVSSVDHGFFRFGERVGEKVKARKITLQRSILSTGWEAAKAFSLQLFASIQASERYGNKSRPINDNLAISFLTDDPTLDEEDRKQAKEELKIIYARCMKIVFYISDDCNYLEIENL